MSRIRVIKKGARGRPVVDSHPVTVRLEADLLKRLDDWRRHEEDVPNRPEGIRRLMELALKTKR
jgi:metal-responsive CopG/Arc/MetJ family transcriptional regulator